MTLTTQQRAILASYVNSDGFKIFTSLMKDEVLKFNNALLNASPENVLNAHNLAKAALSFYEGILDRVDSEIFEYTGTPKPTDKLTDPTEELHIQDFLNTMEE